MTIISRSSLADRGTAVVFVDRTGQQQPPLHFPIGGHLLAFLSSLENGLLPTGRLQPPLSHVKSFSKSGKCHSECEERCMKTEENQICSFVAYPDFGSRKDFQSIIFFTYNQTIDLNNPYKSYIKIINLTAVLAQIINSQQTIDKNKSNMK